MERKGREGREEVCDVSCASLVEAVKIGRLSSCPAWTWRSVMKLISRGVSVLLLAALMNGHALAATPACGDLAGLTLPGATITLAQTVGAGAFAPLPAAAS